MSFSASQIDFLCQSLKVELKNAQVKDCLAFDLARFIIIFNVESTEKRLFFCLQKPFLRFHLIQSLYLPKQSHPLYIYLKDSKLESIQAVDGDRILILHFSKHKQVLKLIVEFFPKHPNYYLVDEAGSILFSLYSSENKVYTFPKQNVTHRPQTSTLLSHEELESLSLQKEKELVFHMEKESLLRKLKKELTRIQRKQHQLQNQLIECQNWEKLQHEGDLLKANFSNIHKGMQEIQVWDWVQDKTITLLLNRAKSAAEQIADHFRKSKKLCKGIPHLEEQLKKLERETLKIQNELQLIEEANSWKILEPLKQKWIKPVLSMKEVKEIATLPYYEYISSTGIKIWVGKNAKNNEKLTFSLARGSDWWLHVQEFPGSHVIIKTQKGEEPDSDTLLDAMQLALHYSRAKQQGHADICITQRKFVSRLGKGQTGKVQISKHKTVFVKLDPKRYQLLKRKE